MDEAPGGTAASHGASGDVPGGAKARRPRRPPSAWQPEVRHVVAAAGTVQTVGSGHAAASKSSRTKRTSPRRAAAAGVKARAATAATAVQRAAERGPRGRAP
ncbi:MAG: hypothetical protein IPG72_04735 [Ardenticatenales bacterium]|nr:hypothetical protein [Ardenticatenales bacterium]